MAELIPVEVVRVFPKDTEIFSRILYIRNTALNEKEGWATPTEPTPEDMHPDTMHYAARLILEPREIVGAVRIERDPLDDLPSSVRQVRKMAVLREYQGHHIGEQLLRGAEQQTAQAQDFKEFILYAREERAGFYKLQGYERTGDILLWKNVNFLKMRKENPKYKHD
jgi:predicted GNAT family N-acyltransferase